MMNNPAPILSEEGIAGYDGWSWIVDGKKDSFSAGSAVCSVEIVLTCRQTRRLLSQKVHRLDINWSPGRHMGHS